MKNPWKRKSRQTVYDNRWITVYHDEVTRPDGNPGVYGIIHYKNRSVGIVAMNEQNQVLLVGQYRYSIDRYSWEIPAGGAPKGEETNATARRELKEETGFTAENMQLILHAHMSNSVADEEGFCYLASGLQSGEPCPEETELLEVRWFPFEEALEKIWSGEITNALSILALQRAAILRMKEQNAK